MNNMFYKRDSRRNGRVARPWTGLTILASVLIAAPAFAQQAKPAEAAPSTGADLLAKKIEAIKKGVEEARKKVEQMSKDMEEAKLDTEKDSFEKMFKGAISWDRHQKDILDLQTSFSACTGALEDLIQQKTESGTASSEDKASLDACLTNCKKILEKIHSMHYGAVSISQKFGARKKYILNGWEQHKKSLAELKDLMKGCPDMVAETAKHCEVKAEKKG